MNRKISEQEVGLNHNTYQTTRWVNNLEQPGFRFNPKIFEFGRLSGPSTYEGDDNLEPRRFNPKIFGLGDCPDRVLMKAMKIWVVGRVPTDIVDAGARITMNMKILEVMHGITCHLIHMGMKILEVMHGITRHLIHMGMKILEVMHGITRHLIRMGMKILEVIINSMKMMMSLLGMHGLMAG